jgi:hypothetical protein
MRASRPRSRTACLIIAISDRKKTSAGVLIFPVMEPYHSVSPLNMTTINHAPKLDRQAAEPLCAFMRSDRRVAISTANYGWNFALGSGVT